MLKVSFIGDISLNGRYNSLYQQGEEPFKLIHEYVNKSDFVIGNLECLAEGQYGENLLKSPRLKTDLETLSYLSQIPVNIVTLAHNHIYDNLLDGYKRTLTKLASLNIASFGAGLSFAEASRPFFVDKAGIRICFLNYVTADTNPSIPLNSEFHVNLFDQNTVEQDIKKNKKDVDFIVLLLHWGGKVENGYFPTIDQTKKAEFLIDAGADLIIGHHAHTLQPYEIYHNKHIFYCLGNFCFDNISNNRKNIEIDWARNTESVIVNILFEKGHYKSELIPIRNINYFLETDNSIIRRLSCRNRLLPILKKGFLWRIYYFHLKEIYPIIFHFFGNNRNWISVIRELDFAMIYKFITKNRQ